MKIYHAGRDTQALYPLGLRRPLLSFADEGSNAFKFWVHERADGAEVFLDSGAHSVASRGTVIDLGEYCDYCAAHGAALETYVQLDVVGDQRQTRANLQVMEDRGLQNKDLVPILGSRSAVSQVVRGLRPPSKAQCAIWAMSHSSCCKCVFIAAPASRPHHLHGTIRRQRFFATRPASSSNKRACFGTSPLLRRNRALTRRK